MHLITLAIATAALAGPLDPPAGPIAPTPGPEPRIAINATNTPGDADSIFRIDRAGSYYLEANVLGVVGKAGIEVAANNVVIDLMGFNLTGVAGSLSGLRTDGLHDNITVRNGTLTKWGDSGIDFSSGGLTVGYLIEDVHSSRNGAGGIVVGRAARIRDCVANSNGMNGIQAEGDAVISGCTAQANQAGIVSGNRSTITGCNATDHPNVGIIVSNDSVVEACCSTNNLAGILGSARTIVRGCTANFNTDSGINVQSNCRIVDCVTSTNFGDGIVVAFSSTVLNCTSNANAGNGIEIVGADARVIGNSCFGNGAGAGDGAGIVAGGSDTRIEDNHCNDNDRGIEVTSSGGIIYRNTCAANTTNWVIAANNIYGPIINRVGAATAAVNGSGSVASTLGSTDANANFSY
ncbi:MAG: right-handed parallel beta-helix repeat-containing protein [Phycisphaerales bacterium]|nr:right-handed parallel beta-helix repeat-containing protein [Phycisphaerales bacterium]